MENTDEIQGLVSALRELIEAQDEYKAEKQRAIDSGSYSFSYYGQRYVDAVEKAASSFDEKLDAIIGRKVAEAIKSTIKQ